VRAKTRLPLANGGEAAELTALLETLPSGVSATPLPPMKYTLNVNGTSRTVDVAPDTPMLWVLRDHLDLVGTKFGCGVGQCGACTIHLNGVPARACMTPVSTVGRMKVTTIEGLAASAEKLHPLQQAWTELDVAQCGYCQAGQIMTAAALLKDNPKPTDDDIDGAMAGNLCRCATYMRIRQGIKRAAAIAAGGKEATQ
jgi:isoquinoline 1-oxidoreductase alpha subunit